MLDPKKVVLLGGVAFLEKYVTVRMGFEVSYSQAPSTVGSSPLLLSEDQDVDLSAPPALNLHVLPYFHHDGNGPKL